LGVKSLKYFDEKRILKEHIETLKQSKKQAITKKMIECDLFIDCVEYEKPVYIAPLGDAVYDEICQLKEGPYDFNSLSAELKSYMREKDNMFFNMYCKKIKRNNSINVDIYNDRAERLIKHNPDHTDDDFVKYVLQGVPIPTPTYLKAKRSANRAYKTVKGLIDANIDKFTDFLTLTFAPEENKDKHEGLFTEYVDSSDFQASKDAYKNCMDKIRKIIKRRGDEFYYIGIWERHKSGKYHFHALCSPIPEDIKYNVPEWLDIDFKTNERRHGKGIKQWEYGKSDVEKIKDKKKMKTYISKYILKSLMTVSEEDYETYLRQKNYFPSRNLEKPNVVNDNSIDFDKLIEELSDKSTVYEMEYINPYNDSTINVKKIEMDVY
jgi:hypothetical protein